MRKDFGKLLEFGDGKRRKPLTGGKRIDPAIRLPSWDRLLEIDRQAEAAAARLQIAIAGPQLPGIASRLGNATSDPNGDRSQHTGF